jgi:hypothetical protein
MVHDEAGAMTLESLRIMIREVLAEEVARLRGGQASGTARPQVREEMVAIRNDAELAAFVRRLADIMKDGRSREEIEQGRWQFRLGAQGGMPLQAAAVPASPAAPATQVARIERGMVTERQVESLPAGTARLVVGKAVRFTPLARDRLRLKGIDVERAG